MFSLPPPSFDPFSFGLTLAIALAPMVLAIFQRGYFVRNLGALKKATKRIDAMRFLVHEPIASSEKEIGSVNQAAVINKPRKINITLLDKADVAEALDVALVVLPFVRSRIIWKFAIPAAAAVLSAAIAGLDIPAMNETQLGNILTSAIFNGIPGLELVDLAPGGFATYVSFRTAYSQSDEWKFLRVFSALSDGYYQEFVSPAVTALANKWKEKPASPP